jgi:hypothetical protein
MIRSVSRVTTAPVNVSSVFQLFSFLVVCSGMILKGFDSLQDTIIHFKNATIFFIKFPFIWLHDLKFGAKINFH